MLTKSALVTVVPGTPGQEYRAASSVCVSKGGDGGDVIPDPVEPDDDGGLTVAPGTPILLETPDGSGGYTSTESVAPAPDGYVCRNEIVFVTVPGSLEPAVMYTVVCTLP